MGIYANNSFSSGLTSVYQDSYEMYYNPEACNELYSTLFNSWKKQMITRTTKDWNKIIAEGTVEGDIFELVEYLKTIPDVKTEKDAKNIIFWQEDERLKQLMSKYGCFSSSWNFGTYLESDRTTAFRDKKYKTEHRLYINVPGVYQHEFIRKFIDTCEEKNLPYYIKYYEDYPRDDSVIVYCNTQHLLDYIKALQEMEKKYPDLIKNIKTPPLLTGKINSWIGYGSEPLHKRDSFNGKRADILEKILKDFVKDWYKKNRNTRISYKGKEMPIWQYGAERILDDRVSKAKSDPEFSPEKDYFYFDGKDLDNEAYMNWIRNVLIDNSENAFDCWLNNKWFFSDGFERKGMQHSLSEDNYAIHWKEYMKTVLKENPALAEELMKRIKETAEPNHIDPKKYCFDTEHISLLREADERLKREQASRRYAQEQQTATNKSKPKQAFTSQQSKQQQNGYVYTAMTPDEIESARRNIGIVENVSSETNTNNERQPEPYRYKQPKNSKIKTKQGYIYEPMTDEQIRQSQEKLFRAPVYVKK